MKDISHIASGLVFLIGALIFLVAPSKETYEIGALTMMSSVVVGIVIDWIIELKR